MTNSTTTRDPMEEAIKFSQHFPKSVCSCGHTGDGANSYHGGIQGHGSCHVGGCDCQQFTWVGWSTAFQNFLVEQRKKEEEEEARRRHNASANVDNVKVGEGVTDTLYTDSHAYTIVEVSPSKKTIKIQRDIAERDNWKPEIIPGGFAGHCTNQDSQRWTYKPDPTAKIYTVRVCKDGYFRLMGNRKRLAIGRHEYYDYNF